MNERIQELAMRANSHHGNSFDLNYKELDVFLSKFAELIVLECVGACYEQTPNWKGEYATAFGDGIEFCINGIKQHFGVE